MDLRWRWHQDTWSIHLRDPGIGPLHLNSNSSGRRVNRRVPNERTWSPFAVISGHFLSSAPKTAVRLWPIANTQVIARRHVLLVVAWSENGWSIMASCWFLTNVSFVSTGDFLSSIISPYFVSLIFLYLSIFFSLKCFLLRLVFLYSFFHSLYFWEFSFF